MRDDLNPLFDYAEALSGPVPEYLHLLVRETNLKTLSPQMISGHLQGRILALLSKLLRPQRILEVGTFTGYSALCLAEGIAPGGELITIEGNPEVAWIAQKYFDASPYAEVFRLQSSKAGEYIENQLSGHFDLIFLDADKRNYTNYFHQLIDRLNPGGLFISDNVLWDGRVVDPEDKEPDVRALDEFNRMLANDPRVETVVLPLRDGLSVARRI
ncbi:methyltransferase [Lewinellaceae bacterium SD302]|nr:methyltransferase [Lewinellaceae bacterium SD302]